ncbi:Peptidoglycan/LPS O-acetylase OafA/YrhL, contains acyltransferase and SGNH-hydrolase domains [Sphingomonas sp. NFR04]|nr:Peptidoglycan/LPS O-acetylase OafA/YrhL, contains acyltransferase and SGNH-hydrolase domains [Sphingomonas sp. NFR04]
MNFGMKLDAANGRPTGFDYMRILLALAVIWMHTAQVTTGSHELAFSTPFSPLIKAILPMFFALSGFLVAGSMERSRTLITFLGNRFVRIYPALAVEVGLSAFVIGTIFTSFPLEKYFTDKTFLLYLLNVTGHIHMKLPGVFLNNPDADVVNMQLWTVPFELYCYLALSVLLAIGLLKRPVIAIVGSFFFLALCCAYRVYRHGDQWAIFPTHVPGIVLISCFLVGVAFYLYREKVPHRLWLFLACSAYIFWAFRFTTFGDLITVPAMGYVTVYLGLLMPRKIALLKGADYSYGLYLYGFVIQQAIAYFPGPGRIWYVNGLVATIISAAFAAFSWHYIEKPALKYKSVFKKLENAWLRRRERSIGSPQLSEV